MSNGIVIRQGEVSEIKEAVTALNKNVVILAKAMDAQNEVIGNSAEVVETITKLADSVGATMERLAERIAGIENRIADLEVGKGTSHEVIDM